MGDLKKPFRLDDYSWWFEFIGLIGWLSSGCLYLADSIKWGDNLGIPGAALVVIASISWLLPLCQGLFHGHAPWKECDCQTAFRFNSWWCGLFGLLGWLISGILYTVDGARLKDYWCFAASLLYALGCVIWLTPYTQGVVEMVDKASPKEVRFKWHYWCGKNGW